MYCVCVRSRSNVMDVKCYVLDRDPELGFGFNLELRETQYFVRNLAPDGPASKAGLMELTCVHELNGTCITGVLQQQVESIINNDTFLMVGVKEPSATSPRRKLSRPASIKGKKKQEKNFPNFNKHRAASSNSLIKVTTLPAPKDKAEFDHTKSLNLSLETLQRLKKMQVKEYQDLNTKFSRGITDLKTKDIEKDIEERTHAITMLERQIISKTDHQFSSTNLFNLDEVPRERKKKFSLERSASDKHFASKSPSKHFFRVRRRDCVIPSPSLNTISTPILEMSENSLKPHLYPISGDSDGDTLDDAPSSVKPLPNTFHDSPFKDLDFLVTKPAYTSVLLEFLINSTRDPSPLLFFLAVRTYEELVSHSLVLYEAQLKAFDVFVTFIHNRAPLSLGFNEDIKGTIWLIIQNTQVSYDVVVEIFSQVVRVVRPKIEEDMKAFQSKLDLGLGNIYGISQLSLAMNKDQEFSVVRDIIAQQITTLINETSETGHILNNYVKAAILATYFHDLCTRYFKKSPSSFLDRVPVLFSLKSAKLPKSKKVVTKCKHQLHPHQTLRFNVQNCTHCKDIIWNVSNQFEAYQCSLCSITIHKYPCLDNLRTECSMALTKPKRYSFRSNNQIKHNSEIRKEEISRAIDSSPVPTISFRPSTPIQDARDKEEISVLKRSSNDDANPPHQLSTSNNLDKKSFKASKQVFRSFSDRTSDRQAFMESLRHRNSLKYENREQYMNSPSHKSVSSNSISNLSESDGSLLSSSTTRSQDSPSSVLPATETGSSETINVYADRHCDQWREDEHITFNEQLISWSEYVPPSRLVGMRKHEIHRQDLKWELIYTERTHVRKLKVMLYLFKEPLLKMPQIVSKYKVENQLFPRLEAIIDLHVTLLTSLLERQQCSEGGNIKISDILIDWFSGENAESIKLNHTEDALNSDSAAATFNKWRRGKDQQKHEFITAAEQDECCKRLRIDQLLANVWQRMTRYHILIENILSTYKDEECEEVSELQKALTECNLTVGAIDSAVNEKRNNESLLNYQEKFDLALSDMAKIPQRFSLNSLVENGRKLLYHGTLNWKVGKNKPIEVHALLLSDLLVLLEYDESKYKYYLKCHTGKGQEDICPAISLSDLIFRHQALDKVSFFVCTFDLGQTPRMYEFSTQSRTERDYWEINISKAVGNFADRNQKLRQNEEDRVEFIKQYKERPTRKESANRSSSTPQPPVTVLENRQNVICSNSQPLEELKDHDEVEILCEVSSPVSVPEGTMLDNIPESAGSLSDDESSPYYIEKKRLSSVFRERIPAYCDPSTYAPVIPIHPTNPSPGYERKLSHDEKKSALSRGLDKFRATSSQGVNYDVCRPRSVSDKEYMMTSLRNTSKSSTDLMTHSLQPLKKSQRISAPSVVSKHPLFKTEMCPIPAYEQYLYVPQPGLTSHLNKSESSLIDKPREERRSITSMFKGLKRKTSKQMKESDYVSQSLPRKSLHISLTPNLERRNRQSDLDMPSVESDVTLTNHCPLQRTSYPYKGMSQDKSVSLDSLENLTPTFKEHN